MAVRTCFRPLTRSAYTGQQDAPLRFIVYMTERVNDYKNIQSPSLRELEVEALRSGIVHEL